MVSISQKTGRMLLARSGNQCAFPNCVAPITDLATGNVTGEMAHIKADSPGGPRYDPDQSEEERQGFDNLMILCPPHHKIIDLDVQVYTVEVLRRMKADHESKQHQSTVIVLGPSALESLKVSDESDEDRFKHQIASASLSLGWEDSNGCQNQTAGYLRCVMYPTEFREHRFSIEKLHNALRASGANLGGAHFLTFEPYDRQTSRIVGDGWRTVFQEAGENGPTVYQSWVMRPSGLLIHDEMLRTDRAGATTDGKNVVSPYEVLMNVHLATTALCDLYSALAVPDSEGISLHLGLHNVNGRLLIPLNPQKRFMWNGPYECHESIITTGQNRSLSEWRARPEDWSIQATRQLVLPFQWWRDTEAMLRDWIKEFVR
jgi:hypothetical protein